MSEPTGPAAFEVLTQDPDDLDALYAELRGVADIRVQAVPSAAEPGEQGSALDLLTVACSGGALTVFLQVVKAVLESRRPGVVLKVRRGDDRLEISAANLDEALPLLRELLDGP